MMANSQGRLTRLMKYAMTAPWPAVAANRLRQITHPGRKIFMIGPNRCATNTFHSFFRHQGLKAIHWRHGDAFLAREVDARLGDDEALRRFLAPWTVFSDFVYLTDEVFIENHTLYDTFRRLFPDAYFIFNDRDVDRWIDSRIRHRGGDFLTRYMAVRGCTREEALAQWREDFLAHRKSVLAYFEGDPRFLHFYIDKPNSKAFIGADEVSPVVDLLRDDYRLSERYWALRQAYVEGRAVPAAA
ncbi:MAG: hypothetical protein Q8J89_00860 [Caulobacter sp.]|nr:hypothetical protein [Caulobacter sp.]